MCEFLSPIWAIQATGFSLLVRCPHFYLGFRSLLVHATGFPVQTSLTLTSFFAGCSVTVTVTCDQDVGEVGEDEVEELLDRPVTTNGT